jgi:O-antigen/teichoic acid export membrane protein
MKRPKLQERMLWGVFWALIARTSALVAGLFTTALLARALPVGDMGVYFLSLSTIQVIALVGQLGLGRVAVRRVSEALALTGPAGASSVSAGVLYYALASAFTFAILFYTGVIPALSVFVSSAKSFMDYRSELALWLVASMIVGIVAQILRGYHDIHFSSLFGTAAVPITVALTFFLFYVFRPVFTLHLAILVIVVANIAVALLSLAYLYPRIHDAGSVYVADRRRMLMDAWPFWISSIATLALSQSDFWVLAVFRTEEELAVYGAALRIVMLASFSSGIVSSVLQPTVSDLHARGDRMRLERLLRLSHVAATLPTIGILLLLIIFPAAWMELLFGGAYRTGAVVLVILSMGDLLASLFGVPGMVLRMMDREKLVMKSILITGMITLILTIIVVDKYGAIGVALAAASGIVMQNAIAWYLARSLLGLRTDLFTLRRADIRELAASASRLWGIARLQNRG